MARSDFTIRTLRALAMQRLGALAAQLKTKDELYDALAEHAPDAVGLTAPVTATPKAETRAKAKAKAKGPPSPVQPAVTRPERLVAKKPKRAAAEAPPGEDLAPAPAFASRARPVPVPLPEPEITAPQRLPKKPRAAGRAVVRDFFVPPGARALPAAFGDDRVLLFPRDPTGVYVSWDLSAATWGHGGLWLVLRTHVGAAVWSQLLDGPQGSVSLSGDFGGASLRAVLERDGAGVLGSPAVLMPGTEHDFAARWRVKVDPSARLPLVPQRLGPEYGARESPGLVGEGSRLLGAIPSRLG
jgi:hypothetical protein